MQLSKHFTLEEFEKSQTATRKGIKNKAGAGEIKNLGDLCYEILEPVRIKFERFTPDARSCWAVKQKSILLLAGTDRQHAFYRSKETIESD